MLSFKNQNVKAGHQYLKMEIKDFLQALEWSDKEIVVTCTMRTPAENAMVGGKPHSKHLTGGAVDIRTSNLTAQDKLDVADVAKHFKLKCLDEGDHLHMQI